jgi:hypothetical protein
MASLIASRAVVPRVPTLPGLSGVAFARLTIWTLVSPRNGSVWNILIGRFVSILRGIGKLYRSRSDVEHIVLLRE